jgi:hypothetical protein
VLGESILLAGNPGNANDASGYFRARPERLSPAQPGGSLQGGGLRLVALEGVELGLQAAMSLLLLRFAID